MRDRVQSAPPLRFGGIAGARWRGAALLLAALLMAGCAESSSGSDEDLGAAKASLPRSGEQGAGGTDAGPDVEVVAGLAGVDPAVANAVAPFDPASAADSLIVSAALTAPLNEFADECVRAQGVALPSEPPQPALDRDALMLGSAGAFPHVESLARDGLLLEVSEGDEPAVGDGPRPEPEPPAGLQEAAAFCVQTPGYEELRSQYELYANVRSAWEEVLAEIDALPEIRALRESFSACLRDEGIPAEDATDEWRFLASIDGRIIEATSKVAGDSAAMKAAIKEIEVRYGKLYAECGRELFAARERLREGERREAFLAEHAVALRQLSDLLYGDGSAAAP